MRDSAGGRTFAIGATVLGLAALAFTACERKSLGGGADASTGGGFDFDAALGDGGFEDVAITGGETLILQAWGGISGEVAADVPLIEPGVGPQVTCTSPAAAGACWVTSCQIGGIGSPTPGYGNFGPMTASVGTTTVALTYNGTGYGTVYFPSPITLGTGGIMTFRGGNGSGVPRFQVSATIPGQAVITSPIPTTDGGTTVIDTSRDLSVTWLPISIGQVHFRIDGGTYEPGKVATWIECVFGGTAGSGIVYSTVLSSMKEMVGSTATYASLRSELETTTLIGGLTITTQSFETSPATAHDFNVTLE